MWRHGADTEREYLRSEHRKGSALDQCYAAVVTNNTTTPTIGGGAGQTGGGFGGGFTFPGLPIFVVGGGAAGGGAAGGGAAGGAGAGGGFAGGAGGGAAGGRGGVATTTGGAVTTANSTAPSLALVQTDSGPAFQFTYNSNNAASLGTVTPHDFAVQATQAINIPPRIRVFQNNRNSEAPGAIMPVSVGTSTAEGLMDMVFDSTRHRLYIANSGLNRVEVFDTQAKQFLSPMKVGQLPHSLALSPDGGTLYVANTGGENITMIDLNQSPSPTSMTSRQFLSTPASPSHAAHDRRNPKRNPGQSCPTARTIRCGNRSESDDAPRREPCDGDHHRRAPPPSRRLKSGRDPDGAKAILLEAAATPTCTMPRAISTSSSRQIFSTPFKAITARSARAQAANIFSLTAQC